MKLKLVQSNQSELANPWDVSGSTVVSNSFIEDTILALKEAKRAEKAVKARIDAMENKIKAYMHECETLLGDDGVELVTWKEQIGQRFDAAKFKKDDSKTYNMYTVCNIIKRFLVK